MFVFDIPLQGFLLGLSSGVVCLASCAPVLIPLFLGEARAPLSNTRLLLEFMGGRLLGYLLFGFVAWATGRLVLGAGTLSLQTSSVITLLLGCLMLGYGIAKFQGIKLPSAPAAKADAGCTISPWQAKTWLRKSPRLIPCGLGFFSGLNLCPPFIVALTQSAVTRSLSMGLLFFASFFAGTSLFFLPFPFLGFLRNKQALTHVGALAAILVGLYYLYSGSLHFLFSTHHT
jgi:sulfite exporter TauE/SafE